MANLYIGTSGFSYPEWRGLFYPEELPTSGFLEYYSRHFSAVEINNTFYRAPSEDTLTKWAAQVPDGFKFIIKMNRTVTHQHRLKPEADEYLSFFLQRIEALGPKLGPILFQFPPYFQADLERLQRLLSLLKPEYRYAFEFRHPSWDTPETRNLLRINGGALCIADTEQDPEQPESLVEVEPFHYLRLRREYTPVQLESWAGYAQRELERGVDLYCFFKHEESGTGPQYAAAFRTLVKAVAARV